MVIALLRPALVGLPLALLLACTANPATDDFVLAAPSEDEAKTPTTDTASDATEILVEDNGDEEITLLVELEFVTNPVPDDVPTDFTGCYEEALACFVSGSQVDVAVRYEPQSGRFWFLDPNSGDTFYADGSIRTTNSFQPLVAVLEPEQEPVEALLSQDALPTVIDDETAAAEADPTPLSNDENADAI